MGTSLRTIATGSDRDLSPSFTVMHLLRDKTHVLLSRRLMKKELLSRLLVLARPSPPSMNSHASHRTTTVRNSITTNTSLQERLLLATLMLLLEQFSETWDQIVHTATTTLHIMDGIAGLLSPLRVDQCTKTSITTTSRSSTPRYGRSTMLLEQSHQWLKMTRACSSIPRPCETGLMPTRQTSHRSISS